MTQEELHEFRKQIDACIVKSENDLGIGKQLVSKIVYAREMGIVRIKLQEAKMWVGKCLEVLGAPFPPELRDKSETLQNVVE